MVWALCWPTWATPWPSKGGWGSRGAPTKVGVVLARLGGHGFRANLCGPPPMQGRLSTWGPYWHQEGWSPSQGEWGQLGGYYHPSKCTKDVRRFVGMINPYRGLSPPIHQLVVFPHLDTVSKWGILQRALELVGVGQRTHMGLPAESRIVSHRLIVPKKCLVLYSYSIKTKN